MKETHSNGRKRMITWNKAPKNVSNNVSNSVISAYTHLSRKAWNREQPGHQSWGEQK